MIIPVEKLDVEGLMLQKAIVIRHMDDFSAKKASKYVGCSMALTTLERIEEGKVREHTGKFMCFSLWNSAVLPSTYYVEGSSMWLLS